MVYARYPIVYLGIRRNIAKGFIGYLIGDSMGQEKFHCSRAEERTTATLSPPSRSAPEDKIILQKKGSQKVENQGRRFICNLERGKSMSKRSGLQRPLSTLSLEYLPVVFRRFNMKSNMRSLDLIMQRSNLFHGCSICGPF